MSPTAVDSILRAVAPVVDALGSSVYDVEVSGSGRARTVRVLIDRAGGVDLDAITAATKAISPVLDAADPFAGPYLLEVSSPGIERPLRRPEHFRRAQGQTVAITHHTETGPQRTRGVVVDADDDGCVVDTDGESERIAYDAITKARTVFDWGATSRPPATARRKKPAKESHA